MSQIVNEAIKIAKSKYFKDIKELNSNELHNVISTAVMSYIADDWKNSKDNRIKNRTAFYFSAEFLIGRTVLDLLNNAGLLKMTEKMWLYYFNDILCEKGLISQDERQKMKLRIDAEYEHFLH